MSTVSTIGMALDMFTGSINLLVLLKVKVTETYWEAAVRWSAHLISITQGLANYHSIARIL
jgi:hypothetical protein